MFKVAQKGQKKKTGKGTSVCTEPKNRKKVTFI